MKQYKTRVVEISWCYQCPHCDHSYSAKTYRCRLTKKRISGYNCTPFPKTCPLPLGNNLVVQTDAYGNKTVGEP